MATQINKIPELNIQDYVIETQHLFRINFSSLCSNKTTSPNFPYVTCHRGQGCLVPLCLLGTLFPVSQT